MGSNVGEMKLVVINLIDSIINYKISKPLYTGETFVRLLTILFLKISYNNIISLYLKIYIYVYVKIQFLFLFVNIGLDI